jgi:ferric-dicitrate binding protein FerR (iron transport regulator)
VQITVSDAALAARPVSGVFDATDPDAFIAFIQSATAVRIERDETRSIVISPADGPR